MRLRFWVKQLPHIGNKAALPYLLFWTVLLAAGVMLGLVMNHRNQVLQYRSQIEQCLTAIEKSIPAQENRQNYVQSAPWLGLISVFFQNQGPYYLVFYEKKGQEVLWHQGIGTISQESLPAWSAENLPSQSQWIPFMEGQAVAYCTGDYGIFLCLNSQPQIFGNHIFLISGLALFIFGILAIAIWASGLVHLDKPTAKIQEALAYEKTLTEKIYRELQQLWQAYHSKHTEKSQDIQQAIAEANRIKINSGQDLQTTIEHLEQISLTFAEQGQKIKEMLTALAEMSSAAQSIASHATASVTTSIASEGDAKKGGEVVSQIIRHMNKITQTVSRSASVITELGERSDKIVDIINVIDDIADQTNLLALNAAIEAARAGAQGRGFAVVADQVRSLAEKTTHATKEISETLSSIQEKTNQAIAAMDEGIKEIDLGAGLAVQAGVSLRKIVSGAKRVTEMISAVVGAAEKQSQAASASSSLVVQIDRDMDKGCEGSKESVAYIHHLAEAMKELSGWMEQFQALWFAHFQQQEMFALAESSSQEWHRRSERIQETIRLLRES